MIQKILNPKTCATCKVCCNYSTESLWDIPGFTLDEYKQVIAKYPQFELTSYCKNNLYYFRPIPMNNNKYLCSFLADNGCILGNDKPFKCAIWPLYVVKHENKLYLAQSNVCSNLEIISDEIIHKALRTSIDKIKKTIDTNPELIEPYRSHFTLLVQLDI